MKLADEVLSLRAALVNADFAGRSEKDEPAPMKKEATHDNR